MFSSSVKRWKILKENISSLTIKSLSQTRWESRIESVKAIRYQAPKSRDALLDLAEASDDPKIKSEAKCLAEYELEDFEFLLGMIIWYDILHAINLVSKSLQSKDMHIDVALDQLKDLVSYFKSYRENGFTSAMISAKEIANEMGVKSQFRERRVIRRKRQFDEPIVSDDTKSLEELFRIDYFLYMVDQVVSSIQIRFEQFQEYDKNFGFLFTFDKLKLLDENVLKTYCLNLENILKHEESSDIDGLDLFSELKILRVVFREQTNGPIEILDYIKKKGGFFSEYMYCLQNIINHSRDCCVCREKIFKVEINKNLLNDVT